MPNEIACGCIPHVGGAAGGGAQLRGRHGRGLRRLRNARYPTGFFARVASQDRNGSPRRAGRCVPFIARRLGTGQRRARGATQGQQTPRKTHMRSVTTTPCSQRSPAGNLTGHRTEPSGGGRAPLAAPSLTALLRPTHPARPIQIGGRGYSDSERLSQRKAWRRDSDAVRGVAARGALGIGGGSRARAARQAGR
jgi:hypothetical protein